ncbi:non-homologous end joining protein Ku [Streptomyces kebangsaanensis]|uniref:non-homologous end joining protein Ku n=1 Tax=Streptomyces kebangsaanensis TaxID=864058 RepID=UPI00093A32FA|nr:Ku protein [Streptomyces kebangsaanensis]
MQAVWRGIISLGIIDIPVVLYKATETESGLVLHQVHAEDGSRVRHKLWCEEEDREIEYQEVAKCYQHPDGRRVVLSDKELATLPPPDKGRISVLASVDDGSIDPMVLGQAYHVGGADPVTDRFYVLLRDTLRESGRVAVTKVALGTRGSLAVLRAHDDLLVLQTMSWPEEVRRPTGIAPESDIAVRPQELKMAMHLMDILSEGFVLEELHDDYQQALRQVVADRLEEVAPPHHADDTDLMALLRSSLEVARSGRADAAPARKTAAGETASAAKRATVKKKPATGAAAAQKTTAKNTAAKKTTPRRAS